MLFLLHPVRGLWPTLTFITWPRYCLPSFSHWIVTASTSCPVGLFLSFFFWALAYFSATTRCSRIILCISCCRSRISHFPKVSQFLLLEVGRNQDLGAGCAPGVWVLSANRARRSNVLPLYIHTSLFLYVAICICGKLNVIHTSVFDSKYCLFTLLGLRWVFIAACGLSLVESRSSSLRWSVWASHLWRRLSFWSSVSQCTGLADSCRWDLPRPRIKPVAPALAGGFLTAGPPRKS